MLAFLGFTNLHDVHKMNALKNLAAATMAVVSIGTLYSAHLIDWRHGLVMAAGTTIGGYSGSRVAQRNAGAPHAPGRPELPWGGDARNR